MHLRTRLLPQHAGRHIRRHHTVLCTVHCTLCTVLYTVHCVHCVLPRLGRTPTTAPPPCSSPRPRPRPPPRGRRTPGEEEDQLQERDDVMLLQVRRGHQPGLRQSVHQPLCVSEASGAMTDDVYLSVPGSATGRGTTPRWSGPTPRSWAAAWCTTRCSRS